jgi:hypothetical protein
MSCKKCAKCCKELIVYMNSEADNTFLNARGIKCVEDNGAYKYTIPYVCPRLVDDLCSIHDDKPKTCKNFKCEEL